MRETRAASGVGISRQWLKFSEKCLNISLYSATYSTFLYYYIASDKGTTSQINVKVALHIIVVFLIRGFYQKFAYVFLPPVAHVTKGHSPGNYFTRAPMTI